MYVGVRAGGGIGDEIEDPAGDPYEMYRIVFDITFFFFVIVILLAIIQGMVAIYVKYEQGLINLVLFTFLHLWLLLYKEICTFIYLLIQHLLSIYYISGLGCIQSQRYTQALITRNLNPYRASASFHSALWIDHFLLFCF